LTIQPFENSGCRVSLEVFDGPLDLLLNLVKERQLDIATVPLATVAQQYFEYISLMEALDIELAAEYLVIAATLVFLKSKSLLPPVPGAFLDEEAETAEEVEERLRARLITYSKYREAGEALRGRASEAAAFFYRDCGDPAGKLTQRYCVEASRLSNAFLAMLRNAKPERRTVARERVSLLAQMDYVMRQIRSQGETLLSALCSEMERETIIVTFLAILELIRRNRIGFEQAHAFDDVKLFAISLASAA